MEANGEKTFEAVKMNWVIKISTFILLSQTIACIPGYRPFANLADLKPDEVVLVGKIRLIPKLHPTEKETGKLLINKDAVGKFYVAIDNQVKPIETYTSLGGIKFVGEVGDDKTFAIVVKKTEPLYYQGAFVRVAPGEFYYLPGGLKIDYKRRDKALYLGTIEYTRNIYSEITKVRIKDQYAEAKKLIRKMAKIHLRRAELVED